MPNQSNPSAKNRLFYFDLLRAFACLCVVMIHVSAGSVQQPVGSVPFWSGTFFNSLSKACVPLFVMLSGALMLDENYAFTKEKWRGHTLKMVLFFVFWSASYCLVFDVAMPMLRHEHVGFIDTILKMLNGFYHLWFIPMIIGLYLLVPLFRLWVKKQNRRYVEYFLLLALIFGFAIPQIIRVLACLNPGLEGLDSAFENMDMRYVTGYSAYFILGWYLRNFDLTRRKLIYVLGAIGLCLTFTGTYLLHALTGKTEFVFTGNFAVNVLLYSVALFVFAKSKFGDKPQIPPALDKLVSCISKYSLGIYAVHAAVIAVVMRLFAGMHVLIMLPCAFIISAALSLAASFAISKIPFFKRFI